MRFRTPLRGALGSVLLLALLLVPAGCATTQKKAASLSPEQVYDLAMKKMAKKRYFAARALLQQALPRIPPEDRNLLPKVQLAIADAFFDDRGLLNYGEALNAYRNFLVYFPDNARADHAQFMVGMSLFRQVLSPDRDQSLTLKAIDEFRKVETVYPDSPYVERARKQIEECYDLLAEHDRVVGWFYQRRKGWRAAIDRYNTILKSYPRFDKTNRVLIDLGTCLLATGQRTEAEQVLGRLMHESPGGDLAKQAKRMLAEYDHTHAKAWAESVSR
jgi:outer membrane protein assembly factor BamD